MPTLLESVGDLVLHFGLIDFPPGDLSLHLGFVLRVIPAGVGGVKNDCNAHRAARSTDPGPNASPALVLREFSRAREMPAFLS